MCDGLVGELALNDRVLVVKPGEKLPAEGVIVEGESPVNKAMTGELTPAPKTAGGKVLGGSINGGQQNIALTDKGIEPLQAQGKTVVFVLVDGKLKGAIALADIVRPEAKQAIEPSRR